MFAGVIDQKTTETSLGLDDYDGMKEFRSRMNPKDSGNSEEILIAWAKAGNLDAFNDLVLQYQDSLYWWVFSLVGDESLAADLTQSAFIAAFQKLTIFNGGSFRAWLFRIARNRSYDELRRLKRHPLLSLEAPASDEDDCDLFSLVSADIPAPEELVIKAEQAEAIRHLLDRLPQAFRQVLQLVDMDGLDYREAAELLNLPLGTFKSRVSRARLKLRDLVLQSGKFPSN